MSVDPVLFVEVSPTTVIIQAVSVGVQIRLKGFSVCIISQAALVSVFLAIADVRLIQISFDRVTSGPQLGIVEVTRCSDAAIVQSMVSVHAAAKMLTLCRTTTKAAVVKLPVPGAAQTAIIQLPLSWAAKAGVIKVTGNAASEAEVIEVHVQEAALCASKSHKTALSVPTS